MQSRIQPYVDEAREIFTFPTDIRISMWDTKYVQEIAQAVRGLGYNVNVHKHNYYYKLVIDAISTT